MPSSFAHDANARTIPGTDSAPPVELRARRPRVLIVAPPSLDIDGARALRDAIIDLRCTTKLFRTTDDFRFKELRDEIHGQHDPFSHLLLVLGQLNSFDDGILHEADTAKIPNVALFALHSRDALERHAGKISQERFKLIVVRTPAEHAFVRRQWSSKQSLVVGDVAEDAARLGELFVGKPAEPAMI